MKNFLPFSLLALLFLACTSSPSIATNNQSNDSTSKSTRVDISSEGDGNVGVDSEKIKLENGLYALFETNMGEVLVQLEMEKAPMTVANFVALAEGNHPLLNQDEKKPFYDGLIFHRVIPQFMCQGGDPEGTGAGGPGYTFPDEFHPDLRHNVPGILSMANSGPNTNGSQFFITELPTPWLDDRHTVFGHVIAGIENINSMARVPANAQNKPNEDITMKVTVLRKGKVAKEFNAPETFLSKKRDLEEAYQISLKEASRIGQKRASEFTWLSGEGYVDSDVFEPLYSKWVQKSRDIGDGLKRLVLVEGSGSPLKAGDIANVHYAGYLANGKPFDSSIKQIATLFGTYTPQREPYGYFPVQCGPQGRVIEGWKRGLIGLQKGSHVKLIIPPALGYGESGAGNIIPPNSTLVFDIWVEDVIPSK